MKKLSIILISGFLIAIVFIFNQAMKDFFLKNNKILKNLNMLAQHEYALNYNVLQSTLFLYYNNDTILEEKKLMKEHVDFLISNPLFKNLDSYNTFLEYKKLLHNKFQKIYKFEKYNLPIKNSLVFLTDLNRILPTLNAPKTYKAKAANILSNIFLAKNAIDSTFYKNIDIEFFKKSNINNSNFNRSLILNIQVFKKYYPKYNKYLKQILNAQTKQTLDKTINSFVSAINQQLNLFNMISYLIILFIILITIFLLWLLNKLEKDYTIIKSLTYKDHLTNLDNRYKFDQDVKQNNYASLIIFNIDHFKTYNDYFGIEIGDKILKKVALRLQEVAPNYCKNYQLYRFGADEFGILTKENISLKTVDAIINYLEIPLKVDEFEFKLSFSAGVSNEKPFLEKADLAVKEAKNYKASKVQFYQSHLEENVKTNFTKVEILKEAIQKNQIVPVFQPIYDNKTKEIEKYEVLARIKKENKLESIWPYLDVAKENKLYTNITKAILKEAFELINKKSVNLSVNFSIDDIENEEVLGYLFLHLTERNGKHLTIELLESEAINDYSMLQDFICKVKKFNVTIAIDDFGSGYSNFARILNLHVDIIKIDGSLIKNIDTDKNSEIITKLIVDFAKNGKIHTIAEFVHSKKVLEKVSELGIEYSQGFYLSPPIENI